MASALRQQQPLQAAVLRCLCLTSGSLIQRTSLSHIVRIVLGRLTTSSPAFTRGEGERWRWKLI